MDTNCKSSLLNLRKDLIKYIFDFSNNREIVKVAESLKSKSITKILLNRYMEFYDNDEVNFISNPQAFKMKKMLFKIQTLSMRSIEYCFSLFKNKENRLILAYNDGNKVYLYDINTDKILCEKETNLKQIENVRHFYDSTNETNYVIVHSYLERIYLLFNCDHQDFPLEKIFGLNETLFSKSYSCLLQTIKNQTYFLTSLRNIDNFKVYTREGEFVKHIPTYSETEILYISAWKDKINEKTYIINGNYVDIKLIDFENGTLFKSFNATCQKNYYNFWSAYVTYISKVAYMVGSDYRGFLRMWDLISTNIVKSINLESSPVGIRQWNDRYVIASDEKNFKILVIDIVKEQYLRINHPHKNMFGIVEKVYIPGYGECIISADDRGEFYLWAI
jgi:hypothetical protein